MKLSPIVPLLLISSASAFAPAASVQRKAFVVRMSDEDAPASSPSGGKLVPIKEETVEFTAGILGGAAGFLIGGPVLGAVGAAAANYASKLDNDVADVISGISKTSIQVYNYLTQLDSKYEILTKAKASLEDSLTKLKAQGSVDPATIEKVESALATTTSKIAEINDEYDLVGAGTTALGVIGDLVEKAVKKAGELNEEYKLSDKAKEALSSAVAKAKEAAKSS
ncbi:hypothetical protein MHU86_13501 [Fragilaria crotonensis]|nr:hypothetical protein MHU86_13501 [Fragilaria crotonensis]